MTKIRGLAPIVYPDSQVLILGSMPSKKSLQLGQYYSSKTNQFWKIIPAVLMEKVPADYPKKRDMLRRSGIALWDILNSCSRNGSLDCSIKNGVVNDVSVFLKKNRKIRLILLNGRVAENHFNKNIGESVSIPFTYVPSSSLANVRFTLNKKIRLWRKALRF